MPIIVHGDARVMASQRESDLARAVLDDLEGPAGALVIERAGRRQNALPPEVGKVLQHVLAVMARGGSVTVTAIPQELTTTAAAEILGVSRPTLMKMILAGDIPAHRAGTHHRLFSKDVLDAARARRERQRAAFDELLELEGDES